MIEVGSKVRHINPDIDLAKGKMKVMEITNKQALCGYDQSTRTYLFLITDLKLA